MRRTISFETGIQNTQLATAIIQLSGYDPRIIGRMVLFPVIYLGFQVCMYTAEYSLFNSQIHKILNWKFRFFYCNILYVLECLRLPDTCGANYSLSGI